MGVRWRNYVWKGPRPAVGPDEVEKLESAWGVRLPEEYRNIAHLCHGMVPEPNVFDVGDGANVFNNLLTLTSAEREWVYSVEAADRLLSQHVPSGIFPFGMTPGREYLCFDYRDAPPGQPHIVLVTVEMEIYPIADSFREFLAGLHELRE